MEDWSSKFFRELDWWYTHRDEPTEVEDFLRHKQQELEEANGEPWQMVVVCNELGSLYRGLGRYSESLSQFQTARELGSGILTNGDRATLLNNMAGTCRLMKNERQAEELFVKAIDLYEQEGMVETPMYASALNNLALVYQGEGRLKEASTLLGRALALIRLFPDRQEELAITYQNLASVRCAEGDYRKAAFYIDRAIQEYRKLPEEDRSHYAAVLNCMAGILSQTGNSWRALALYREAAEYARRFGGENEEFGIACQNMGRVYEHLKEQEEACSAFRRAEDVYTHLFGPEHPRTRTARAGAAQQPEEYSE